MSAFLEAIQKRFGMAGGGGFDSTNIGGSGYSAADVAGTVFMPSYQANKDAGMSGWDQAAAVASRFVDPGGLFAPASSNTFQAQAAGVQAPAYHDFSGQLGQFGDMSGANAAATAGQQQQYVQSLQDMIAGKGPSLAQQQLDRATESNIAQATGAIASQRGLSPAMAKRLALQSQAGANQQAAAQSAQIRMQEQLGAMGQLGGALAGMRGQDLAQQQANIGGYGMVGGLMAGQQGMQLDAARANAEMAMRAQDINAQIAQKNSEAQAKKDQGFLGMFGSVLSSMAEGGDAGEDGWSPAGIMATSKKKEEKKGGGLGEAIGTIAKIAAFFGEGGEVPGQNKYPGDDYRNDVVPALLSSKEAVIPVSIMEHPQGAERAAGFVQALQAERAKKDRGPLYVSADAAPTLVVRDSAKPVDQRTAALNRLSAAEKGEREAALSGFGPQSFADFVRESFAAKNSDEAERRALAEMAAAREAYNRERLVARSDANWKALDARTGATDGGIPPAAAQIQTPDAGEIASAPVVAPQVMAAGGDVGDRETVPAPVFDPMSVVDPNSIQSVPFGNRPPVDNVAVASGPQYLYTASEGVVAQEPGGEVVQTTPATTTIEGIHQEAKRQAVEEVAKSRAQQEMAQAGGFAPQRLTAVQSGRARLMSAFPQSSRPPPPSPEQQQMDAMNWQTSLDEQAAQMQADALAAQAKQRAVDNAQLQALIKDNNARIEAAHKAVAEGKIDPQRFWHNRSTGQKVANSIGIALYGYLQGVGAINNNPGLELLQQRIREDVDAQKEDLNNKKTTLAHYIQRGHDMETAKRLAIADGLNQAAMELKAKIASLGPQDVQAAGAKQIADLLVARASAERQAVAAQTKALLDQREKDREFQLKKAQLLLSAQKGGGKADKKEGQTSAINAAVAALKRLEEYSTSGGIGSAVAKGVSKVSGGKIQPDYIEEGNALRAQAAVRLLQARGIPVNRFNLAMVLENEIPDVANDASTVKAINAHIITSLQEESRMLGHGYEGAKGGSSAPVAPEGAE